MTKSTVRPKTTRKKKTAAAEPQVPAAVPSVTPHEIAVRAFEYYCARGGQPGGELDDWLRAERELMASLVAGTAPPPGGEVSHT